MSRAGAIAICGALLTFAPSAAAQELTERLRIQGGYITEARPSPTPRTNDLWIGAVPELALLWTNRNVSLNLSYQLTGALHSLAGATELANRVALVSQTELSRRTTLLLSGEAAQTTFSNLLVSRAPTDNTVALFPAPGNRTITARVLQGLAYEVSPRLRLQQLADAGVVTTLPPAPPLDTFTANVSLGADYIFPNDAVGAEVRATYANTQTVPPALDQQFVLLTAAPRWRHDWSQSINTSLSAGATAVLSPDQRTSATVVPFGRAAVLYTYDLVTSIELSYATGAQPSPLTGQMLRSDQVRLTGYTPISEKARVNLAASVGYLRGRLVDLTSSGNDQSFEAGLADVDVTWQPTRSGLVQLFARYQVQAQVGEVNQLGLNPSFIRDVFLVGVQLSSRPPVVGRGGGVYGEPITRTLPQRVDQGDDPRRVEEEQRLREQEQLQQQTPAGTPERGPSRWIHVTPAAPPRPADDD